MVNKGQGLPLNLIVLAIIAALVLVLIIAFTVGGAGSTFSKLGKAGTATTGDELSTVREGCRIACTNSKSATTPSDWRNSQYCVKASNVDLDSDGTLAAGEKGMRCWSSGISVACTNDAGTRSETDCLSTVTVP